MGCKNGELFEPEISEKYAGFGDRTMNYMFSSISDFDKLNCDYIGYYSYFKDGGGHIWDPIPFGYDDTTREFTIKSDNSIDYEKILTGDFSDIAGVWRNAKGNTIILQNNGMDSSTESNNNLEFVAENIKKKDNGSYSWSIIAYYGDKAVGGYGVVCCDII